MSEAAVLSVPQVVGGIVIYLVLLRLILCLFQTGHRRERDA